MVTKYREQQSSEQSQARTLLAQAPTQVNTPAIQTAATHEFYGTAAPFAEVNIQSQQGGTIILLTAKEGDSVQQGDVLVQFDESEQQLQIQKAKSTKNSALQQVQQAKSNLKNVQATVSPREQKSHETPQIKASKLFCFPSLKKESINGISLRLNF